MHVFYDTEFTDLLHSRLISLGFVAANRATLYVECAGWQDADCSEFVRAAVLPLLDHGERLAAGEAALRIAAWLRAFSEPVLLLSDSGIDAELLGELMHDGAGVRLRSLAQVGLFEPSAYGELVREALYERTLRRHHALDDARALCAAWQALHRGEGSGPASLGAPGAPARLWLDDLRPAPAGWTWVKTAAEAVALLQWHRFDAISLDHDLGDDPVAGTGYDVLVWLERVVTITDFAAPAEIEVHSSDHSNDPPAAERMRSAIAAIARASAKQPGSST